MAKSLSAALWALACIAALVVGVSCTVAVYNWIPRPHKQAEDAPPQVSFDEAELNLGRVPTGTDVECTLHYRNETKCVIKLTNVKTSCGCLAVGDYQDSISQGEAGAAHFRLSTRGVGSGNTLRKRITMSFTACGGSQFVREVDVTASVAPDVTVSPASMQFDRASGADATSQLIVRRELASVELFSSLKLEAPPFIQVREVSRDASQAVFALTIPASEPSVVSSSVEVAFADTFGRPRVSVPVELSPGRRDVVVEPEGCIIVVPPNAESSALKDLTTREFTVESADKAPVEVLDIQGSGEVLGWQIIGADGSRRRVKLWLKAVPQPAVSTFAVTLNYRTTDGRRSGQLPLDVHIYRRK